MIDEADIFNRFHATFETELPPGASLRLRSVLVERLEERRSPHTARLRVSRATLRLAAVMALIAVVIGSTAVLIATHRPVAPPVPTNPAPVPRSLVGSGKTFLMMSATTGWWANDGGVLRTTDGGASWHPVLIPVGSLGRTFFLDTTHAWAESDSISGSPEFKTYHTSDGGTTWSVGTAAAGGPSGAGSEWPSTPLYFVDPNNGWLIAELNRGQSNASQVLYRTSDGGMHWTLAVTSGTNRAPRPNSSGKNLSPPCLWESVAFASVAVGWLSVNCVESDGGILGNTDPPIFVTHDGGVTWLPTHLPFMDAGVTCPPCTAGTPVIFDPLHAVMMVRGNAGATWGPVHLLSTSDGGDTWTGRTLPSPSPAIVAFVDADHGWSVASIATGNQWLYRTTDGGKSWTAVDTNMPMIFGVVPRGETIAFVDQNHGFALVGGRLYRTTDGGRTWVVVESFDPLTGP